MPAEFSCQGPMMFALLEAICQGLPYVWAGSSVCGYEGVPFFLGNGVRKILLLRTGPLAFGNSHQP